MMKTAFIQQHTAGDSRCLGCRHGSIVKVSDVVQCSRFIRHIGHITPEINYSYYKRIQRRV